MSLYLQMAKLWHEVIKWFIWAHGTAIAERRSPPGLGSKSQGEGRATTQLHRWYHWYGPPPTPPRTGPYSPKTLGTLTLGSDALGHRNSISHRLPGKTGIWWSYRELSAVSHRLHKEPSLFFSPSGAESPSSFSHGSHGTNQAPATQTELKDKQHFPVSGFSLWNKNQNIPFASLCQKQ